LKNLHASQKEVLNRIVAEKTNNILNLISEKVRLKCTIIYHSTNILNSLIMFANYLVALM
jgi:hypothetical protein